VFDQFLQITYETAQRFCHGSGLPQPEPPVELFLPARIAAQLGPVGPKKKGGGAGRRGGI
jgi:hypothetical protein